MAALCSALFELGLEFLQLLPSYGYYMLVWLVWFAHLHFSPLAGIHSAVVIDSRFAWLTVYSLGFLLQSTTRSFFYA